jgi:hypothetical protein
MNIEPKLIVTIVCALAVGIGIGIAYEHKRFLFEMQSLANKHGSQPQAPGPSEGAAS